MKRIKKYLVKIVTCLLFILMLLITVSVGGTKKSTFKIYEITGVKSYERMWEYLYSENGKTKSVFIFGEKKEIGTNLIIYE